MKNVRTFLRDTRGAAAAEMALMIPFLVVLMYGAFEAGHFFYTEQKVIKAVREGARYAGRLPFSNFPCGGTANTVAVGQVQKVTRTGTLTGTVSRVPNMVDADVTVTHRCDASWDGQGIYKGTTGGAPIVRVQARADYASLFNTLGFIDSTSSVYASAEATVNGI